jgi:pimeloyl-ACP methyl ester carboxylesterase
MRRWKLLSVGLAIVACSPGETPRGSDAARDASRPSAATDSTWTTPSGATAGFARVNGTTLYYERRGEGRPVVLIEGANLPLAQWDAQFDALARRYAVIRYDVRGFGRSGPADAAGYMAHDDLHALLQHFGVRRAVLIGLSLGGRIALDFALAHPEMVDALVLAGPGLSGFDWSSDSSFLPIAAAAEKRDSVRAALLWLEHAYMAPAMENPALAPRLRELAVANARMWVSADSERVAPAPAAGRLREIKAPTLVMIGDRDVPDIHRIVEMIMRDVPGAKRVVFERTGHVLHMEQPEKFNAAVLEFLDQLPGARSP